MKTTYLTLMLLLGLYCSAKAQTKDSVEIGFGAGFNASYVYDTQSGYSSSFLSGLNAGLSANYYFSDSFSMQAKVSYDQKGWANSGVRVNGQLLGSSNIRLNYITVPLMAELHFGSEKNWYAGLGPYAGFLTGSNSAEKKQDLGLDIDLGVKFPLTDRLKLFIEEDGQLGFSSVLKGQVSSSAQNLRSATSIGIDLCL